MKDLHSGMTALVAIAAATLDDDNTPPTIDLQGYNAAEIVLAIGAGGISFSGTNKIEFKLTHSDDDSSYEAVTAADVLVSSYLWWEMMQEFVIFVPCGFKNYQTANSRIWS